MLILAAIPVCLAIISAAVGAAADTLLVIDDSVSTAIKYDGPWKGMSQPNLDDTQSPDYLGTLTFSNLSAAFANISFTGALLIILHTLLLTGYTWDIIRYGCRRLRRPHPCRNIHKGLSVYDRQPGPENVQSAAERAPTASRSVLRVRSSAERTTHPRHREPRPSVLSRLHRNQHPKPCGRGREW